MVERLPQFAERDFATRGSVYGALCHHSEEDENGWDWLVEFQPEETSQSIDMRPGGRHAYVQIKSKRKGALTCTIKVSNAIKFAKHKSPCFIVLLLAPEGSSRIQYYAVHFWEELMARSLEAGRTAQRDGVEPHKRKITISFRETDNKTDSLFSWIDDTIRSIPNYEVEKKRICDSVGFSDVVGSGTVEIGETDYRKVVDHLLGYTNSLPINKLQMSMTRFGISLPEMDVGPGMILFERLKSDSGIVKVTNTKSREQISLNVEVMTPGAVVPREFFRVRAKCDFFEMSSDINGATNFTVRIDFNKRYSIADLHKAVSIFYWHVIGSLDVQLWMKAKRVLGGKINLHGEDDRDWETIHLWVSLFIDILGEHGGRECLLSISDLIAIRRNLSIFWRIAKYDNITMKFVPLPDYPDRFDAAIYYNCVTAGSYVFCMILKRDVIKSEFDAQQSTLVFGPPVILEQYYKSIDDDGALEQLENDCRRYADDETSPHVYNLGGQIMAMAQAFLRE